MDQINSFVFNDDCIKIMKQYTDKYFDLAVVDPPYGINAGKFKMGENINRKDGSKHKYTKTNLFV